MKFLRLGTVTVAVLALMGLFYFERTASPPAAITVDPAVARIVDAPVPVAPGARAIESQWFCTAGFARDGVTASHEVIVSNPTDAVVDATVQGVRTVASQKPTAKTIAVPAHGAVTVPSTDLVDKGVIAIVVSTQSGQLVAEHRVTTKLGVEQVPCASSPASNLYFPYSNTEKDATARVVVYNPLASEAVVDVVESTTDYVWSHSSVEGVIIAPRSARIMNINVAALRRDRVSLHVEVREGRVVGELVQYFDPDNIAYNEKTGEKDMSTTTAAPTTTSKSSKTTKTTKKATTTTIDPNVAAASSGEPPFERTGLAIVPAITRLEHEIRFVDGYTQKGVLEHLVMYNPNRDNVEVEVSVEQYGAEPGAAEPLSKTIPGTRTETIALESEVSVSPAGFHRIIVRSLSKGGIAAALVHFVVAERDGGKDGEQLRPSSDSGFTIDPGVPFAATRWTVGTFDMSSDDEGWVLVDNPSKKSISLVTLYRSVGGKRAKVAGIDPIEVPPGAQIPIQIEPGPAALYEVESSSPVLVERRWTDDESNDVSGSIAVADGESLAALDSID